MKHPQRKLGIFIIVAIVSLGTLPAGAWAEDETSDYGPSRKLGRGLSNVAFGTLEVPQAISDRWSQEGMAAGLFWGPIDGLGRAFQRTVVGAFETVTFAFPGYKPVLKPEFVLPDTNIGL